jgi:hypothetical protein
MPTRTFHRAKSAGLIALIAWFALSGTAAWACSCLRLPDGGVPEAPDDVVFTGTVESIEEVSLDAGSFPERYRKVCLSVERTEKGAPGARLCLATGLGLEDCGFPFAAGSRYLVQAHATKDHGDVGWTTSICDRTEDVGTRGLHFGPERRGGLVVIFVAGLLLLLALGFAWRRRARSRR